MLTWDDSLLFPTCIVVKNRIDLLNTVNDIVSPWTITFLESFSSLWVLQQTHKRQWFHIVHPQNFHQSSSHGISEFCFPIFFCEFWFLIKRIWSDPYWHIDLSVYIYIYIYIYILFWASFEKFELMTIWVGPYCSFRKKMIKFCKKSYIWLDVVFFQYI